MPTPIEELKTLIESVKKQPQSAEVDVLVSEIECFLENLKKNGLDQFVIDDSMSQCPFCGATGPDFEESDPPANLCYHDPDEHAAGEKYSANQRRWAAFNKPNV